MWRFNITHTAYCNIADDPRIAGCSTGGQALINADVCRYYFLTLINVHDKRHARADC